MVPRDRRRRYDMTTDPTRLIAISPDPDPARRNRRTVPHLGRAAATVPSAAAPPLTPAAGAQATPIEPGAATWTTWVLDPGSQMRPSPAPRECTVPAMPPILRCPTAEGGETISRRRGGAIPRQRRSPMRLRIILATLILILALTLTLGAAAEDPPGPTTPAMTRTAGLSLAGVAEVDQQVNDFAPGAQTSVHSHPGLIITAVLAGDLIYHNPEGDHPYKAGESFVEQPDVVHFGRNPGTTPTRIVSSFVITQGATLTV